MRSARVELRACENALQIQDSSKPRHSDCKEQRALCDGNTSQRALCDDNTSTSERPQGSDVSKTRERRYVVGSNRRVQASRHPRAP